MKKYIAGITLCLIFSATYAADNSGLIRVTSVTTRASGGHVLHFDGTIPSQGCTHNDNRAVIVDAGNGSSKVLLDEAFISLTKYRKVTVRVSGCIFYNQTENSNTAPQIIRMTLY